MKFNLRPLFALFALIVSAAALRAGITVHDPSPAVTGGTFSIDYGLGQPFPGKWAFVTVSPPSGGTFTIGAAENVSDHSQTCYYTANQVGAYIFSYEYSYESQGVPRTTVSSESHYIGQGHAPTIGSITAYSPDPGFDAYHIIPGGAAIITASAGDQDGNLQTMLFYVNPPNLSGWQFVGSSGISGGSASASVTWQVPSGAMLGSWTFHVRAVDSFGGWDSDDFHPQSTVLADIKLRQQVSSVSTQVNVTTGFTPTYSGGSGTGVWQFSVVNQTNWGGNQTGTLLPPSDTPSISWTTPAQPTDSNFPFKFWIIKRGDATYHDSNPAGMYDLAVMAGPTLPIIAAQPSSQTITAGGSATFSVTATSTNGTLSYQWYKNGTLLSGQTGSALALTNVPAGDNGSTYYVVVSNASGPKTSNTVTLTVNRAPGITNPSSVTASNGSNASFTISTTGTPTPTLRWQRAVANSNTFTDMSDGGVYSGTVTATLLIQGATPAMSGDRFHCVATNGITPNATSAPATLTVSAPPVITTPPVAQMKNAGDDVTFTVVATTSTPPISYQWRKNGANLMNNSHVSGATAATLFISNVQNADVDRYDVVLTTGADSTASASVNLYVNPAAPVIVVPPASLAVSAGSPATFTVTAKGTNPFTYQWKKDGVVLNGETNATLTMGNVQSANLGDYTVVIANAVGSVTSPAATLTIGAGGGQTAPAAPQQLAVSGIGSSSFTATWGSSANATGYQLDVATDASFSNFLGIYNNFDAHAVQSLTVTGLSSGITYYWRVRASNTVGTSGSSQGPSVTIGTAADLKLRIHRPSPTNP